MISPRVSLVERRRDGKIRSLHIAIAGCGIAGMAAALLLARDGHRVTVFERFAKPRPLGSGLMIQPTGLAILDQLDLAKDAIAVGQRIDRLIGKAADRTVLDVRYSKLRNISAFGIGIHRPTLFSLLHDRLAQLGVEIATSREVVGAETRGTEAWLTFSQAASEGPFDLIIDALGTRSALAADVAKDLAYGALWTNVDLVEGFDPHALSQRYRAASVMAGVLPIGRSPGPRAAFFWSLRANDHADWIEAGLDPWRDEVRRLWPATAPMVDQIRSADELTIARYSHRTLPRPVDGRVIHIGDSWHSASPQLGQGANMALLDAFAVAAALRDSPDLTAALQRAVGMRNVHVQLYQLLTRLLTPVYQSDSRTIPLVRDWLMGPLSKLWPMTTLQASLVSGLVGSPLRRLGIDFALPQRRS